MLSAIATPTDSGTALLAWPSMRNCTLPEMAPVGTCSRTREDRLMVTGACCSPIVAEGCRKPPGTSAWPCNSTSPPGSAAAGVIEAICGGCSIV
jgi:hypothetical protein